MNKFKNIKAIFFDVGDTLYSNEEMEKEYPRQLYKLIAQTKGIDKEQAKVLLKETSEKLKQTEKHVTKVRAMAELGYTRAQTHEAFCKVEPSQFLTKDPKLDAVISELSKKYRLGIISNFKKSHMLQIFKVLGISENQLPLMVTEDIVTEIKPAHEPFLKAIELSGFKPKECLFIGDSPGKDMRPAKEVDMATILIKHNPEKEDLINTDANIEKVEDILEILT
jgi:HAD superfamily hydrolase (TIGR01549 family)